MRVHFIGVAGRAMGGIAIALARAGHRVSGSDEDAYEPMRGWLEQAGIRATCYAADHVPPDADAIVVGRRVATDNVEVRYARQASQPCLSFPAFLRTHYLKNSRNAVVAGGVGKTTTTALLAWILEHAGKHPDFLIGGMARNFQESCRLSGAGLTVLEGDEYASGPDDDLAKFMHYRPEVAIVTNLLADHPDLYPEPDQMHDLFATLVGLVPSSGCLVCWSDDLASMRLASTASCAVVTAGTGPEADARVADVRLAAHGTAFTLDGVPVELPLHGWMNVRNAAMAAVAASRFGVPLTSAARALARFEGLADRQDAFEAGGRIVVRDKASHPESLRELRAALRQRFPRRRLVSVMQPRATGGRRWIYQRDLPAALSGFDSVILTSPYEHKPASHVGWRNEPFCLETLARDLIGLGVAVARAPSLADLPRVVRERSDPGDVVLLSLREQFSDDAAAVARGLGSPVTIA